MRFSGNKSAWKSIHAQRIMNTTESNTEPQSGLDHGTTWSILIGLAMVVIGAGLGSAALFAGPEFLFGKGELCWWIATGGALLCTIGGWRAARRWSCSGDNRTADEVK